MTRLGLSLAEGKAILSGAQRYFVREQCRGIAWSHSCCEKCGIRLGRKGYHDRQIRTVFGRVVVRSARLRHCQCQGAMPGTSFSPLLALFPAAVTPELEWLQVKWAAHLSYVGWLWGAVGLIHDVPIRMAIEAVCDRVDELKPVGEFLGA